MAWTLGTYRIFVQEIASNNEQIIARLQPLKVAPATKGSVYHLYGFQDEIIKVSAFVVGDTDKNFLKGFSKDADYHELVGPEGSLGNFYVKTFNYKRVNIICQTLRGDLPVTDPVYLVEMDLWEYIADA